MRTGSPTQTFPRWTRDRLVGLAVSLAIGPMLVSLLYAGVRRAGRRWWIWATGFAFAYTLLINMIYPVFIAPLFNDYKPLPEGDVRNAVMSLARANGIPTEHVEWFDASRQTTRVSANVSGIAGLARINLNDNLLNKTSLPEIRAVLAHEMGHYVLNHSIKLAVAFTLIYGLAFAIMNGVFDRALARWGPRLGLRDRTDPAALPLVRGNPDRRHVPSDPDHQHRDSRRGDRSGHLRAQRRPRATRVRDVGDAPFDLSQAQTGPVRGIHLLRPSQRIRARPPVDGLAQGEPLTRARSVARSAATRYASRVTAAAAPTRRGGWLALVAAAMLAACATPPMNHAASPAVVAALAPTGTLRAAINFGNPVLATKDPATGEPRGVSVDLARELAKRLGVPMVPVTYTAAGKVVGDARANAWDVAFVAIDPARAVDMDYSAPYVLIEGAYAVPRGSTIRENAEVDRAGNRVVVATGSAYDLYLSRELKHAQIVRTATSQAPVATMMAERFEVAAGVKQQLESDANRIPDVRLLDGRFMVIRQAMATPAGRPEGARYLAEFIEEMKVSGFVAGALGRSGVDGAAVAPPAGREN